MYWQIGIGFWIRISLASLIIPGVNQVLKSQIIWDGDCDQFWDGGCTIDDVPKTNWDNDNHPGPGSEVMINLTGKPAVANVTVSGLATIEVGSDFRILRDFSVTGDAQFSHTSLEINISESLQVGGTLTTSGENLWSGGDVTASAWENEGDLTIQGNSPWLVATQLRNTGTVTHDGTRSLRSGATFLNEGLWHFTRNNADVTHDTSEGVLFTNAGSGILRRSGEGIATMGAPFLNSGGVIEIKSGELSIAAKADFQGGSIGIENNGTVSYINTTGAEIAFTERTEVSGMGNLIFRGTGLVRIPGELYAGLDKMLSSNGFVFENGSTIDLTGTAVNREEGKARWTGTWLQGDGEYVNRGELTIEGQRLHATLANHGTVKQQGSLALYGGTVRIEDGGEHRLIDGDITQANPPGEVVVLGELTKEDSQQGSTIHAPVRVFGNGKVELKDSTDSLFLAGGGTFGDMALIANSGFEGKLVLSGGTFDSGALPCEVRVVALGEVEIGGGATWRLNNSGDRVEFDFIGLQPIGPRGIRFKGSLEATPGSQFVNTDYFYWEGGTLLGGTREVPAFLNRPGRWESTEGEEFTTRLELSGGEIDGVVVNEGFILQGNAGLTLQPGALLLNQDRYDILNTSSINGSGTLENQGRIFISGSTSISAAFDPADGVVQVGSNFSASSLTLNNLVETVVADTLVKGAWIVGNDSTLQMPGQTILATAEGVQVTLNPGASFPQFQPEEIQEGSELENESDLTLGEKLTNHGTLTNKNRIQANKIINGEQGKNNSVLRFLDEQIVIAGLPIKAGAPPRAEGDPFDFGYFVSEDFENQGFLQPGGEDAAGYLPIAGDFTQTDTGVLIVELGGATNVADEPATFDQVIVTGTANLDGALVVGLLEDFVSSIQPSDTFAIVDGGGRTGEFSNVADGSRIFTAAGEGSFLATYGDTGLILSDFQTDSMGQAPVQPVLLAREPTESGFTLGMQGSPGMKYHLEKSINLFNWSIAGTVDLDSEGKDAIPQAWDGQTSLFYRLRPR